MTDPRMNSIHLDVHARREAFREARAKLLGASTEPAPSSDTSEPYYWLVESEAVHPLKVGVNTIGRMLDNDVAIRDGSISRRHAAIVIHANDGCELHDTASKNGTYLNGQKISGPAFLKAGDEIRLCDRSLVFHAGEAAPAPACTSPNSPTVAEA